MQKIPSQLRSNQYEILLKDNIVNFSIRIVSGIQGAEESNRENKGLHVQISPFMTQKYDPFGLFFSFKNMVLKMTKKSK